jgi:hypothetical protein
MLAPNVPFELRAGITGLGCFDCEFLGQTEGVHGIFQRSFAEFVSAQVISLVVGDGSSLMSMDCEVV